MMVLAHNLSVSHKSRGFSLAELAIVLGVIGGILAGLWQVVNIVWENTHREQLLEATTITVHNIRQYYSGRLIMDTTDTKTKLIPKLVSANVIPSYLVRIDTGAVKKCTNVGTVCADTPFGYSNTSDAEGPNAGTFQVCAWDPSNLNCDGTNAGTSFGLRLLQLDIGTCAQMINKLAGVSGPSGLLAVNVNTAILPVPVSAESAVDACKNSAQMPAGNTVSFIYRLTAAM